MVKTPKPLDSKGKEDRAKFKKCQYKKCKNPAFIHTKKGEHFCAEHYHLVYDAAMEARGTKKVNRLRGIKVVIGRI